MCSILSLYIYCLFYLLLNYYRYYYYYYCYYYYYYYIWVHHTHGTRCYKYFLSVMWTILHVNKYLFTFITVEIIHSNSGIASVPDMFNNAASEWEAIWDVSIIKNVHAFINHKLCLYICLLLFLETVLQQIGTVGHT